MLNTETQKVTAHLPVQLLKEAQEATGKGLTETLKIALEQLSRAHAYEQLRLMRGKIDFSIDVDELRKDK
jgi:hypothetical protein